MNQSPIQSLLLTPVCWTPWCLGFGWHYTAEPLCTLGLTVLCHATAVPLDRKTCAWQKCGIGALLEKGLCSSCSGFCHHIHLLFSALGWTGKPHPLRTQGRKPAIIPNWYYSSKMQSMHFIFSVFYIFVCTGAWRKAGKLVSKSSIRKQLHFGFLWPVSLVNKLNMSSHCDVLAESGDASQGGVNGRMSCRMGGVCIPPALPYSRSRIVCRILCTMLVPGLKEKKNRNREDENWRDFRKDNFRNLKGFYEKTSAIRCMENKLWHKCLVEAGPLPWNTRLEAELRAAFEHP